MLLFSTYNDWSLKEARLLQQKSFFFYFMGCSYMSNNTSWWDGAPIESEPSFSTVASYEV
jgi:hypothetical protein